MGGIPSDAIGEVTASAIFQVLATIFVVLRLLARRSLKQGYWWDDWTLVISLVIAWGLWATFIVLVIEGGAGQDLDDLPVSTLVEYKKVGYAGNILTPILYSAVHISLVLQYWRLFAQALKTVRWACWLIGFVQTGVGLAGVLVLVFECKPIRAGWDLYAVPGSTCINGFAVSVAFYTINSALDVALLLIPVLTVWNLQISRTKKLQLCGVFAVGLIAIAFSVIRIVAAAHVNGTDSTYWDLESAFYTVLEPAFSIIATCLPMLPKYMGNVFKQGSHRVSSAYSRSKSRSRSRQPDLRESDSDATPMRTLARRKSDASLFSDNEDERV